MNEPATIRAMIAKPTTLAVIGLSENPQKPSHFVSAYMQQHGFTLYPINPAVETVLGVKSYASLTDLAAAGIHPEVVDVFRLPSFLPAIVDEMIALGLKNLWIQQGIVHQQAAAKAEAAGIKVVMDHCIMVEHRHLAV